jgi:hypothetical protein
MCQGVRVRLGGMTRRRLRTVQYKKTLNNITSFSKAIHSYRMTATTVEVKAIIINP